VFGLILDTSDADAKVGAVYTTGEGATKTGAGIPTPIPRLTNTLASAFDNAGNKKVTTTVRVIINFFIFLLLIIC
jgi:hypothetical protein